MRCGNWRCANDGEDGGIPCRPGATVGEVFQGLWDGAWKRADSGFVERQASGPGDAENGGGTMTEQSKTVEWASVNDALERAVDNLDIEWVDDSFSYEYGSIIGTEIRRGAVLAQDVIEIDVRVPYDAGWMPGEDENGILYAVRTVEDQQINVTVEPLEIKVRLENGFWLVRGIFNVEEVD